MKPGKHPSYDPTSARSIIEYAKRLEGHTLREMSDAPELQDPHKRKGAFGNAVEEYYFKYALNSDSAPDFAELALSLRPRRSRGQRKASSSPRNASFSP